MRNTTDSGIAHQKIHGDDFESPEDDEGARLTADEEKEVRRRTKLRPVTVYEIVRREGEDELARPTSSLIWSGIAAGLSIGFSVFAQAALRHYLPDAGWKPLVECWGYSVGFLIVILARQQLFTEITLSAMLPFLAKPDFPAFLKVARLWTLVFLANIVGTAIFGAGIAFDAFDMPEIRSAALDLSRHAIGYPPLSMFMHAVIAGWLIATIVWLLPSAKSASFAVISLLTYLVALFGLAHIVAGSVETFSLIFIGEIGVSEAVWRFFLPTLAGNIAGGAALFALISYAQIAEELRMENQAED